MNRPDTKLHCVAVEKLLASFVFSLLLFLFWGTLTAYQGKSLLDRFDCIELLWFVYNLVISLLFLARSRPRQVSMDVIHWAVALITSFSGFFFSQRTPGSPPSLAATSEALVVLGLLLGIVSAVALGRSYDFLPALRGVTTSLLYRYIRHPMYLSSIVIKLGYLLKHASWYNGALFLLVTFLYIKRAFYEEEIMMADERYTEYMKKVRCRFIPGLF